MSMRLTGQTMCSISLFQMAYRMWVHWNKNKDIGLNVFVLTTFQMHWDLWRDGNGICGKKLDWELGFPPPPSSGPSEILTLGRMEKSAGEKLISN